MTDEMAGTIWREIGGTMISEISKLYKARWQVEIFFREIKQLLHIKLFMGTSQNAVMIQIWTALITIIVLKALKAMAKFNWHLSKLVAFIRLNLFVKINLQHGSINLLNNAMIRQRTKNIRGFFFEWIIIAAQSNKTVHWFIRWKRLGQDWFKTYFGVEIYILTFDFLRID